MAYVLLIITTTTLFFNGYSTRRKSVIGILATVLLAQVPLLIDLTTKGISQYGQDLVSAQATSWIMAIMYIIFFWGLGYVVGGINLKKKDNTDELPGKTSEYMRFALDDFKR